MNTRKSVEFASERILVGIFILAHGNKIKMEEIIKHLITAIIVITWFIFVLKILKEMDKLKPNICFCLVVETKNIDKFIEDLKNDKKIKVKEL